MKNKKPTDQVKPGQIRRNRARTGHPASIVKVAKKRVDFIGITEAKSIHGKKNVELEVNPEPNNTEKAYLRPEVETIELRPRTFGPNLKDWKIADIDKPKVKEIIKNSNKKR